VTLSPPPLLHAGFSRRQLLAAAGVSGLLLGASAFTYRALRAFGPPRAGLRIFDELEFEIIRSIAEAKFPSGGSWPLSVAEARVPEFVDLYVSGLYDDLSSLYRTLVRAFDIAAWPSHRARFHTLTLEQREHVLQQWSTSPFKAQRAGYQSLTFPIHMGYFENESVEKALGFDVGCQVSGTRPTLWSMKA
jgi:Gluconate 2-dehydrogenase subunit 3